MVEYIVILVIEMSCAILDSILERFNLTNISNLQKKFLSAIIFIVFFSIVGISIYFLFKTKSIILAIIMFIALFLGIAKFLV